MRVVSEILNLMVLLQWHQFVVELALMDAGVNIRKPVAGIAMGLITEGADWR